MTEDVLNSQRIAQFVVEEARKGNPIIQASSLNNHKTVLVMSPYDSETKQVIDELNTILGELQYLR